MFQNSQPNIFGCGRGVFAIMARAALVFAALFCMNITFVQADVAVISNRTAKRIVFAVAQKGKPQETIRLASGDVYSFFFNDQSALVFHDGQKAQQFSLTPQQVYFFGSTEEGKTFFQQMPLTGNAVGAFRMKPDSQESVSKKNTYSDLGSRVIEIPVKVFVDDNEQARRDVWEERLARRFDKVNSVYERLCRVRFKVTDFGTWNSDNNINDFTQSMKEFEILADNRPGAIAIGFTSQYGIEPGVNHIGMTRQPFHTHVLIREFAPQFTENERVEALIHELGHWLGAVHNPDPHCYMNPVLSDRVSRQVNYIKTFNPINTLLLNLWADCWNNRRNGLLFMSDKRMEELIDIYTFMSSVPQTDSNAAAIQRLLIVVAKQEQERREKLRQAMTNFNSTITMPDDLETYAETIPELQEQKQPNGNNEGDLENNSDEEPEDEGHANSDVQLPSNPEEEKAESESAIPQPEPVQTKESNEIKPEEPKIAEKPTPPALQNNQEDAVAPGELNSDDDLPEEITLSEKMSVNKAVKFVTQEILKSARALEKNPRDNAYVNALIQSGAAAAMKLPEKHRVRAFLVSVGLALDASNAMKSLPVIGERVKKMDSYDFQSLRETIIKQPSINAREDWAQHFGVSAALSALMSPDAARQAGLIKELKDEQTPGNAFDTGDLAADFAGCTFAQRLLEKRLALDSIAQNFDVTKWIPEIKGYKLNIKKPEKILKDVQKMVDEYVEGNKL